MTRAPLRSASSQFEVKGIYLGQIASLSEDGRRLNVTVQRISGSAVYKDIEYLDSGFSTAPRIGEPVAIGFIEGRQEQLIVLGRLRSSIKGDGVDTTGAVEGYVLIYDGSDWVAAPVNGTDDEIEVVADGAGVTIGLPPDVIISNDLTVEGDLTVNGTTTMSVTITTDDPIIFIGGDVAPTSDDNKDRGVAFRWHNGTAARVGFFGYDDSTEKFTFIPNATITNEVVSGSIGELDAQISWANIINGPNLSGGLEGQILAKTTDANYDVQWIDNYTGDLRFLCKNDSGVIIPKGSPVMSVGAVGDQIRIAKAVNDGSIAPEYMLGVAIADIANGSSGYVQLLGELKGINTSAYSLGTILYISPTTPGTFTSTIPVAPALDMPIAIVTKINTSNGRIYIRMWSQGQHLRDIYDVNITTPTSGQYLKYDGSLWVNDTIDLGTDTSGNYVASLVAGTGVSLANNTGEGATPSISIGQAVATNSSVTFNDVSTTANVSVGTSLSVGTNLTVTGNFTVNGTTTTVNSTTVTIDDPILTLGGDTAPAVDDNKDRGVEFRYHDGSSPRLGFFGYDDSSGKFAFLLAATNTSEVFSGTKAEVDATVDWSNIANKPDPVVTVTLAGDVTGTANTTLADLASGSMTITTTIASDSVALGTDTTGNYVAGVTGSGSGISVTGTGEGASVTVSNTGVTSLTGTANQVTASASTGAVTLSLPQSIHTAATPTFNSLTLGQTTGTSPLTVSSTTLVTNLNADLLDGQHATFWTPTGAIHPYAGLSAPTGWLFCAGQSVSRSTYADLFAALTESKGTATMTIATPCVVTLTGHGMAAGTAIYFTTTGALPTGLSADTTYYVQNPGTNTFNLNTSQTNAIANSSTGRINTSGSQSGTHTVFHAPWGGITSVNFAIPDLRGRVGVGMDNMGGTDAGRLSANNVFGLGGGAETHTLTIAEMPSHDHTQLIGGSLTTASPAAGTGVIGQSNTSLVSATGGGGSHNNMQPYALLNYIIKH